MVRLKCRFGDEISVFQVPIDIEYEDLRSKIEEIFGKGVHFHKYEDEVGDPISIHSKEDIKEAFRMILRINKKDSSKSLTMHLTNGSNTPKSAPSSPQTPVSRRRTATDVSSLPLHLPSLPNSHFIYFTLSFSSLALWPLSFLLLLATLEASSLC